MGIKNEIGSYIFCKWDVIAVLHVMKLAYELIGEHVHYLNNLESLLHMLTFALHYRFASVTLWYLSQP